MSEENKAFSKQFIDGMNAQDTGFKDRLPDPNFVEHDPEPGVEPGIAGIKQMMTMFYSAFHDFHVTMIKLIAEGEISAGHMTTEGTQTGEFMGIPTSGKKISITEMQMVRISNGKAVEHRGLASAMAMMQQLGAISEG